MNNNVIVIVGPTAVGKTELSLQLANDFNGEIVSADSMQVYRGLDIGTAKATTEEQIIPHHMIDIVDPEDDYTVAQFQIEARKHIEAILKAKKTPIIVGGSGLYIQSILFDYNFPEAARDEELTKVLELEVEEKGIEDLYEELKQIDPIQASKIHPNNHRRVIRAIEIYRTTNSTMTELQAKQEIKSIYNPIFIGLSLDRKILYERINRRVDSMIENNLLQEVKLLYDNGLSNKQSMSGIGYKEFIPYFKGEMSFESCVDQLKQNSRRFAKRQLTWFRNKMDISWYNMGECDDVYGTIKKDITLLLNT